MTKPHAPDRIAGELASYFFSGESAQGLSSSWGPLASIALGGFGGSPDPERRIADGRFRLGPVRGEDGKPGAGASALSRAREVRTALSRLDARLVSALFASYGPTPWSRILDSAFGRGMGLKVQKKLGDLAAVALLTPELAEGFAHAPPPESDKQCWQGIGGYLVALCLEEGEAGKARAAKVKKAAEKLLAQAREAYVRAREAVDSERPKKRPARAKSGDRRRTVVESEGA
jgi:hypothetical protein